MIVIGILCFLLFVILILFDLIFFLIVIFLILGVDDKIWFKIYVGEYVKFLFLLLIDFIIF